MASELVEGAAGKPAVVVAAPRTPQDSTRWTSTAAGGDVLAQVVCQPRTLYAGLHSELIFHLTDAAGQPVVDLGPYLGAMGHVMAVSEDLQDFVHAHPEQFSAMPPRVGGPDVVFHAMFAKAGAYRLWAQFQRGDQLVVASFVVHVETPPLPAGIMRALLGEY